MSKKEGETPVQQQVVQERKYALLQETSGEENESWYVFIKYQGNEEALKHLNKQLEQVEWYLEDDLSTFDLELDYLVCERTAKEMTKVDINHYSFHRKFDGTLKKIDLGLKSHHSNIKKMGKIYDVLGYGGIENYIDQEDIDPEDLRKSGDESSSEEESEDESEEESSSEEESESEEEEEKKKKTKLPPALNKPKIEIPRFAKAKIKHK
jgi:hypothetical protein